MYTQTGYSSPVYQAAYKHLGDIFPRSIIKRPIEGTNYFDLTTIYPFIPCGPDMLYGDYFVDHPKRLLDESRVLIGSEYTKAISYVALSDPLVEDSAQAHLPWERAHGPLLTKYKEHFICDLQKYELAKLPDNHKRNIKKSQNLEVSLVINHEEAVRLAIAIYPDLILKHGIKGITAYSEEQLKHLVTTPGAVVFKTLLDSEICNVALFYIQYDDVYYHLGPQTPLGYQSQSMFQTMHCALEFFKNLGLNRCLIGGIADGTAGSGLARFKQGFSHRSSWNWIYKEIRNPEIYEQLSKEKSGSHFPLYRSS